MKKNPVYRFLLLSRLWMSKEMRVRLAFRDAKLPDLMQAVVDGRFDFLSECQVTEEEKEERRSEMYRFKHELETSLI